MHIPATLINTAMTTRNPRRATIPIHSGLTVDPVGETALETRVVLVAVFSLVVEGAVFGTSCSLVPLLEAGDVDMMMASVPESVTSSVADYKIAL